MAKQNTPHEYNKDYIQQNKHTQPVESTQELKELIWKIEPTIKAALLNTKSFDQLLAIYTTILRTKNMKNLAGKEDRFETNDKAFNVRYKY